MTLTVLLMADDAPDATRQELDRVSADWTRQGRHVQHFSNDVCAIEIDLYRGAGASAWQRAERAWGIYQGSLMLKVPLARGQLCSYRAAAALTRAATAASGGDRRPLWRVAGRLEREAMPWIWALAQLVRAALAAQQGDSTTAVTRLGRAVAAFDALTMQLWAHAARRCWGRLLGGATGEALVARAEAGMAEQGIQNPDRMMALYVPGFPDGSTRP